MEAPEPSEPLYHAVALGMTAYARLAFRVEVLRPERASVERGSLLVSTHRAETDAQLVIYAAYWHARVWRDPRQRVGFVARQDLFEPGFFAGFPSRLPTALRRLLFPLEIAPYLPLVRVYPIRSARSLHLVQGLRLLPPETPLEDVLEPGLLAELRRRAPVRTAGDACRGDLADLLWRRVGPEELRAPTAWSRWASAATDDVRFLIERLRAREALLLFPEGRPSPDGAVGPLRRGLGLLVRRGRPERIHPIGVAYDPLVRGRTRAYVSFGRPYAPGADAEPEALRALALAMPVTAGGFVAHALARAAREQRAPCTDGLREGLDDALAEAEADGRDVERALVGPARHARLSEALGSLRRRGLLSTPDGRTLRLDRERLLADPDVRRLEREWTSVRDGG